MLSSIGSQVWQDNQTDLDVLAGYYGRACVETYLDYYLGSFPNPLPLDMDKFTHELIIFQSSGTSPYCGDVAVQTDSTGSIGPN